MVKGTTSAFHRLIFMTAILPFNFLRELCSSRFTGGDQTSEEDATVQSDSTLYSSSQSHPASGLAPTHGRSELTPRFIVLDEKLSKHILRI